MLARACRAVKAVSCEEDRAGRSHPMIREVRSRSPRVFAAFDADRCHAIFVATCQTCLAIATLAWAEPRATKGDRTAVYLLAWEIRLGGLGGGLQPRPGSSARVLEAPRSEGIGLDGRCGERWPRPRWGSWLATRNDSGRKLPSRTTPWSSHHGLGKTRSSRVCSKKNDRSVKVWTGIGG